MPDIGIGRSRTELERDDVGLRVTLSINVHIGSVVRDPEERYTDEQRVGRVGGCLQGERVGRIVRIDLFHGTAVVDRDTSYFSPYLSELILDHAPARVSLVHFS